MTCRCPNCGYTIPPVDKIAELRAWCSARGDWVGPGDVVHEAAAAAVIGRSSETLRFWRSTNQKLPCIRTRAGIRYRLADLASFIEGEC